MLMWGMKNVNFMLSMSSMNRNKNFKMNHEGCVGKFYYRLYSTLSTCHKKPPLTNQHVRDTTVAIRD